MTTAACGCEASVPFDQRLLALRARRRTRDGAEGLDLRLQLGARRPARVGEPRLGLVDARPLQVPDRRRRRPRAGRTTATRPRRTLRIATDCRTAAGIRLTRGRVGTNGGCSTSSSLRSVPFDFRPSSICQNGFLAFFAFLALGGRGSCSCSLRTPHRQADGDDEPGVGLHGAWLRTSMAGRPASGSMTRTLRGIWVAMRSSSPSSSTVRPVIVSVWMGAVGSEAWK